MKDSVRWIGLVIWIGVCLGAGSLGAIATTPGFDGGYGIEGSIPTVDFTAISYRFA